MSYVLNAYLLTYLLLIAELSSWQSQCES